MIYRYIQGGSCLDTPEGRSSHLPIPTLRFSGYELGALLSGTVLACGITRHIHLVS